MRRLVLLSVTGLIACSGEVSVGAQSEAPRGTEDSVGRQDDGDATNEPEAPPSSLDVAIATTDFANPCERQVTLQPFAETLELEVAATSSPNDPMRPESLPHIVIEPVGPARDELFLFLPGTDPGYLEGEQSDGGPEFYLELLSRAAAAGYHVLGLVYVNDIPVNVVCNGLDDCHESVRLEIITGRDEWSWPTDATDFDVRNVEVGRTDSIENRTIRALKTLGWNRFLAGEAPDWQRIAVGGHSQGGGHAAMLGKLYPVRRVLMFDATENRDWMTRTSSNFATGPERYFGFTSIHDVPIATTNLNGWNRAKLLGPVHNVDSVTIPSAPITQLITSRCAARPGNPVGEDPVGERCPEGGNEHGTTSLDDSVPRDAQGQPVFAETWCYMLEPAAGPVTASPVTDEVVVDNDGDYDVLNAEISPDGHWLTAAHQDRTTGVLTPALYRIESSNAELLPACVFEGVQLKRNASLQFGSYAEQPIAVGLTPAGNNFVVVEPRDGSSCESIIRTHALDGFPLAFDTSRLNNTYPSRDTTEPWVTFHFHGDGVESVYLANLGTDDPPHLIWSATVPEFRSYATRSTVSRWFRGHRSFVSGRWSPELPQQLELVRTEISQDGQLSTHRLMSEVGSLVDSYPFIDNGQEYLLSGIDSSTSGGLYSIDSGSLTLVARSLYEETQSSVPAEPLGLPSSALSFEVFSWEDELYASYQIGDRNDTGAGCTGPHCTYNELWVGRLQGNTEGHLIGFDFACRVSAWDTGFYRGKVDPEPVGYGSRFAIFYQRTDLRQPNGQPDMKLARVDLGDKNEFDRACRNGVAGRALDRWHQPDSFAAP